jgi:glycosyltransferase involved in cell wall biosynthesis
VVINVTRGQNMLAPRRLRIAVVTETYPPEINGVASTVLKLVNGLVARGHELQLVRPRRHNELPINDHRDYANPSPVLCASLPIPKYPELRMGLPARSRLWNLWSKRRPDVVHIATEGPLGWSALRVANSLGIPVSSDFRTNFHAYSQHYGIGWLRRPIMSYLRHFHNLAQATFVPTEAMRKELLSFQFNDLKVISRGVDTVQFDPAKRSLALRSSWQVNERTLVVLYVGRLAAEKNTQLLVAAFKAMQAKAPNVRLVVVGDGPERRALAERFPGAFYAGMQTGESLAQHYASADLFLFPSLTETFGNVTLEALASGLPVIAFNYAAAAAHVKPAKSGFLAEFGREDHFIALAAGIATVPHRLVEMRIQAREGAMNLSWDRVVNEFETSLRKLSFRPGTTDVEQLHPEAGRWNPMPDASGAQQRRL